MTEEHPAPPPVSPLGRTMSVRATLMTAASATFVLFAVVGLAMAIRIVPRANDLTRRSGLTLEDYAARTQVVTSLDSIVTDLWRQLRLARVGPLATDSLRVERERVESLLRGAALLAPLRRSADASPEISGRLERADLAVLDLAGTLLGAIGSFDVRDVPAAERLLQHADSLGGPLGQLMTAVTRTALADLTRGEAQLAREANSAATLVMIWLTFALLLLPTLWWLLRRRLFEPLAALDRSLTRIDQGDLDVELPVTRDDEMGRLSQHFNRTTQVLRSQRAAATREAAQAALEASEARYRSAFEEAAVGLAEVSLGGRYLRVNRAMSRMLGRGEPEIVGRPFADFTHPDDAAVDRDMWVGLVERGESIVRVSQRYLRGDGSTTIAQSTATLLRGMDGTPRHVLLVIQDVTEQRRLERDLLQTTKMDAVGQLAGGVAHDFNNLLTGIIGYADLIEHDAAQSTEVREDAAAIRSTALRGADLARSLLTLARRNPHQEEPFALEAVLRETVDLLKRTFDRRIEVRLRQEATPTILGDRSLLSNALLNLALNARDAMSEGGVLAVRVHIESPDAAFRATHALTRGTAFAVISMSDSGSGMAPAVLDRIFEPFYTTKPMGKGTGLGLSMVYGTVKDHGGAITVDSAPGEGTTFTIHLPCASDDVAVPASARSPLPAETVARVLIVDDEELVRDVASRMLRRLGYEVETASDGMAALERLARDDHGVDLVLMDGNMPRLHGVEAARRLHARHPQLPMIYASGFFDAAVSEDLPTIGVRERLAKPYTMDSLSRAVARCLGRATGPADRAEGTTG